MSILGCGYFARLVLALLVRLAGATTNTSADQSQYLILAGIGWVSLARGMYTLPVTYLYASVNHLASSHAVRAMGYLFGKFVQLSSPSGCL